MKQMKRAIRVRGFGIDDDFVSLWDICPVLVAMSTHDDQIAFSLNVTVLLQGGVDKQSRVKKFFEKSIVSKRVLLGLAMLVLSAIDGVRSRTSFHSVSKGLVVSIVMLITTTLLTLAMIIIWRTPTLLFEEPSVRA